MCRAAHVTSWAFPSRPSHRPTRAALQADLSVVRVRRVNATGWTTVAAGVTASSFSNPTGFVGDGSAAVSSTVRLTSPAGLASDTVTGQFWVADGSECSVCTECSRMQPGWLQHRAPFRTPALRRCGPARLIRGVHRSHRYRYCHHSSAARIRVVNPAGIISTLCGNGVTNAPPPDGARVNSSAPCGIPKGMFFYRSQRFSKWNNSVFYVSGGAY